MSTPLRIVSISLGSSSRDKTVEAEFLGRRFHIERRGTDGDMEAARRLIGELDGTVAAIGLGGIDLYLIAGNRRYVVRDALRLARAATVTPVVDGSGLKNTLERETVLRLAQRDLLCPPGMPAGRRPRFLVVAAVDRFGVAEAVDTQDCEHVFGDLIFAAGVPVPLRSLWSIRLIARIALPAICRLPFRWIYPVGERQTARDNRGSRWLKWADVIAGDFHFIGRNLPKPDGQTAPLAGKTIITNTTTEADVEKLRALGLSRLVTTTPRLGGRSFGTNVMEGVLVALSGKRPEELTPEDYLGLLQDLKWEPIIEELNP